MRGVSHLTVRTHHHQSQKTPMQFRTDIGLFDNADTSLKRQFCDDTMLVTIKPTCGNSLPRWCSTLATIRLVVVQLFD